MTIHKIFYLSYCDFGYSIWSLRLCFLSCRKIKYGKKLVPLTNRKDKQIPTATKLISSCLIAGMHTTESAVNNKQERAELIFLWKPLFSVFFGLKFALSCCSKPRKTKVKTNK